LLLLFLAVSLRLLQGFLNIEFLATINNSVVEFFNCFKSALNTILFVLWVFVANESEWSESSFWLTWNLSLLSIKTLDYTELAEYLSKFGFIPSLWEVLDVDVVECFSDVSSIFWLIWMNLETMLVSNGKCLSSEVWVSE